eukprot:gnl/Spiro4/10194_TR5412_c1_g1_i1.p1 gnl/Spiro4/10194_TR5412_c1_g1~~gnl/Spiro4/10194_TR5412_c1_g1_i1.p1  ORF type:complete len:484 (+),score=104.70 gnl/Spiro4/10194_TR5412_c1_g1_i1:122-1573(+)
MSTFADRCLGLVLGAFVGDALGAPFEGESAASIARVCPDGPWDMFDGRTLPDVVASAAVAGVDLGPSRVGHYTDDTEMLLALTDSLVQCGGLCPTHVALNSALWFARPPNRGGYSAATFKKLCELVRSPSTCFRDIALAVTATDTHTPGGSLANGGAMRIAPLGVLCRHLPADAVEDHHRPASPPPSAPPHSSGGASSSHAALTEDGQDTSATTAVTLRSAVAEAIALTHTHPEAIEGALLIARAVALVVTTTTSDQHLDPLGFLRELAALPRSEPLRSRMATVTRALETSLELNGTAGAVAAHDRNGPDVSNDRDNNNNNNNNHNNNLNVYDEADRELLRFGTDTWFQIRASDAVPAVLYMVARYGFTHPEECLVRVVALGGDCDTLACMAGAILGALHGASWLPRRWIDQLENGGESGRECAEQLAARLAALCERNSLECVGGAGGGGGREARNSGVFVDAPHQIAAVRQQLQAMVPPSRF